jgi:signal peptidase I
MELTNLSQSIADLHVVTIVWFALALTVLRLALVKLPGQVVRAVVEIIEAALIAGVFVFLIVQPFVVKAFYIPSGSMLPTLLVNDHILVNRYLYRFEIPHHDDVVVFNAPPIALEQGMENETGDEHIDYIKRLIGLPGDIIQVHAGTVTINGTIFRHDDLRKMFGLSNDPDSRDTQHLKFVQNAVEVYDGSKWTKYTAADISTRYNGSTTASVLITPGYVERNDKRDDEPYIAEDPDYDLKLTQDGQVLLTDEDGIHLDGQIPSDARSLKDLENAPPGKVAQGELIVMGDNRNDSNDSSRWGPLDESRLVGRAVFIFYPFSRVHAIK